MPTTAPTASPLIEPIDSTQIQSTQVPDSQPGDPAPPPSWQTPKDKTEKDKMTGSQEKKKPTAGEEGDDGKNSTRDSHDKKDDTSSHTKPAVLVPDSQSDSAPLQPAKPKNKFAKQLTARQGDDVFSTVSPSAGESEGDSQIQASAPAATTQPRPSSTTSAPPAVRPAQQGNKRTQDLLSIEEQAVHNTEGTKRRKIDSFPSQMEDLYTQQEHARQRQHNQAHNDGYRQADEPEVELSSTQANVEDWAAEQLIQHGQYAPPPSRQNGPVQQAQVATTNGSARTMQPQQAVSRPPPQLHRGRTSGLGAFYPTNNVSDDDRAPPSVPRRDEQTVHAIQQVHPSVQNKQQPRESMWTKRRMVSTGAASLPSPPTVVRQNNGNGMSGMKGFSSGGSADHPHPADNHHPKHALNTSNPRISQAGPAPFRSNIVQMGPQPAQMNRVSVTAAQHVYPSGQYNGSYLPVPYAHSALHHDGHLVAQAQVGQAFQQDDSYDDEGLEGDYSLEDEQYADDNDMGMTMSIKQELMEAERGRGQLQRGEVSEEQMPLEEEEEVEAEVEVEFEATAAVEKFDYQKELVGPWSSLQNEAVPYLKQWTEDMIKNTFEMVYTVNRLYIQSTQQTRVELDGGLKKILQIEQAHEKSRDMLVKFQNALGNAAREIQDNFMQQGGFNVMLADLASN